MVSLSSTQRPLLLDTNILIYHLKRALSAEFTEQLALTIVAQQAYISVITRIEMLAWKGHTDLSLQQTTHLLAQSLNASMVKPEISFRRANSPPR